MRTIHLVCAGGYVSGKEIMALELAVSLAKPERNIRVVVIVTHWCNNDFINRLKRATVPFYILPLGFISATLSWPCLRMTAEQALYWPILIAKQLFYSKRDKPFRVVHTNWHHLLLLFPTLKEGRDSFWIHEFIPDKPQYRYVFRVLASRLRYFICISNAVANSLRSIGIEETKIKVVHNGIQDPNDAIPVIRTPKNPKQPIRIGIVGQIGPWKGHEDLFVAFAMTRALRTNIELHIFGNGESCFLERLRVMADELGITNCVVWRGFVENRNVIYNGLDICAVPSRFEEPLGLSAVEPGFYGLPVIATRRGGLPEVVENGVTGILVEPNDQGALKSALLSLIDDPLLRVRLGANAGNRVKTLFSSERMCRDFERLLALS